MQTSKKGIDLIKSFEGLRLKAYFCPAGVLTIGYGHTGSDVTYGLTITEEQATELLIQDLNRFEVGVDVFVEMELSQNEFDALVSLSYNIGLGAFKNSTLVRHLNKGNLEGAANQFLAWTKGGGKILPGLVRRREAERKLFLS